MKIPGWRKLGGRDIVREGDVEWPKGARVDFVTSEGEVLAILTIMIGCQMCTKEMQDYYNDIWRKLPVKNATKK